MFVLLAIKMERRLDFVAETHAFGRVAVATMLLLVHISCSTTLHHCQSVAPKTTIRDVRRYGTRLARRAG